MKPEASLPRLEVPATCPYPKPDRSKLCPHIPIPEDPSYCYPPIYAWVFQVVSFPQDFLQVPCMQLPSLPYLLHALVPLRPKYSPQHPILKHPQPTFLPQCERASFTTIQNNRQNYNSGYLNLYIFGYQIGKQKILQRMIASIPWFQPSFNFFLNRILIR